MQTIRPQGQVMMKALRTVTETLLLLVLLLQAACSSAKSSVAGYGKLSLHFQTDASSLQAGRPVHMQFSVTNEGSQTRVMESKDRPVMDIDLREGGTEQPFLLWSGQNPDKVQHRIEWKPGESRVIELDWTPQPDQIFQTAHLVYLTGILHEDQRGGVQGVTVSVCARSCQ